MKPTSFHRAEISVLGLLVALTGCSSVSTRHATTEEEVRPAFIASPDQSLELPVPLQTASPLYPYELRRAGITGTVQMNGVIDKSGKVRDLEVVGATDRQFIAPSLAAVRQWTFEPARREGVPVATRVNIPLEFMFKPD